MRVDVVRTLQLLGLVAFLVAGLSIGDMYLPRPYDGVVLEADVPGRLEVRQVVPGSGAARAGIRPGTEIVGIDRNVLQSSAHAAVLLNERAIGETVPYLIRDREGLREVEVRLGHRQLGSPSYLYAVLLGFTFFFVGAFVLHRQPGLRAAQVFFVLSVLFLLFLVCRLRPASYSWTETLILATGMAALLFMPAAFLHFFLIFPRPVALRPRAEDPEFRRKRRRWLLVLTGIYLLPVAALVLSVAWSLLTGHPLPLISGAPLTNWWTLAAYMLLGLAVLAVNTFRLPSQRERRGAALVLAGALFGLLPFLAVAVALPSYLYDDRFLVFGLGPLILVPVTFAYAIVRFQLLNIRVILRKSLIYTAMTAVVTGLYVLALTLANSLARGSPLAESKYFPLLFALAIVLLFEPLRRGLQRLVDRLLFAERSRLQGAIRELEEAFAMRLDLGSVVRDLVERLPQLLGLHFAALYLAREDRLERVAGPPRLPETLPRLSCLEESGQSRRRRLRRIEQMQPLSTENRIADEVSIRLLDLGVEFVGVLASRRRGLGVVLLSGREGQVGLDDSELELIESLLQQAAIALETSLLLEERTHQAELERELQIAASVQAQLLPRALSFGPGWKVAALCRPARHVGGDFFTELPGPTEGSSALVYGDVSGKSVSGALVMMAAHEALHSLAMTHRDPTTLLELANQRLYGLGQHKSFVALTYLTAGANGGGVSYILAGQPQPLLRLASGEVKELPLPDSRLPLGALSTTTYQLRHSPLERGDLVLGYSDGVVEAVAPSGEVFGIDRLARVVADATAEPQVVIRAVIEALTDFTQGSEPYDDLTLVAVARDREAA